MAANLPILYVIIMLVEYTKGEVARCGRWRTQGIKISSNWVATRNANKLFYINCMLQAGFKDLFLRVA
jgi:hypothetical protein